MKSEGQPFRPELFEESLLFIKKSGLQIGYHIEPSSNSQDLGGKLITIDCVVGYKANV